MKKRIAKIIKQQIAPSTTIIIIFVFENELEEFFTATFMDAFVVPELFDVAEPDGFALVADVEDVEVDADDEEVEVEVGVDEDVGVVVPDFVVDVVVGFVVDEDGEMEVDVVVIVLGPDFEVVVDEVDDEEDAEVDFVTDPVVTGHGPAGVFEGGVPVV